MFTRRLTYCVISLGLALGVYVPAKDKGEIVPKSMVEFTKRQKVLRTKVARPSPEVTRSLDALVEQNREILENFQRKVQQITQTSYGKLRALFSQEQAIIPEAFEGSYRGKCAFKFEPEALQGGILQQYMKGDEVYLVPMFDKQLDARRLLSLEKEELASLHRWQKKTLKTYTPLLTEVPADIALGDLFKERFTNAYFVKYDSGVENGPQAFFRFRKQKERDLVLMEGLCPYYGGCAKQGMRLLVPYGDPYMYCYYDNPVILTEKRFKIPASERVSPQSNKLKKSQLLREKKQEE